MTEGLISTVIPAKAYLPGILYIHTLCIYIYYYLAESTWQSRYSNSCWLNAMFYKLHMTRQDNPRSICHILSATVNWQQPLSIFLLHVGNTLLNVSNTAWQKEFVVLQGKIPISILKRRILHRNNKLGSSSDLNLATVPGGLEQPQAFTMHPKSQKKAGVLTGTAPSHTSSALLERKLPTTCSSLHLLR